MAVIRKRDAIIIMGVSGCGKSTVGKALAAKAGYAFADADDHHPAANIEKMKSGVPLSDADREPWLQALADLIDRQTDRRQPGLVLACSALKRSYRQILSSGTVKPRFVFLEGPMELILARMEARNGHFMPTALLRSQFETLEVPASAIRVPIDQPVEAILSRLEARLWPEGL